MGESCNERPRIGLILGAPRSGTSWLHRLLAAHPAVATTPELHLFSDYLRGLVRSWDRHVARMEPVLRALEQDQAPPDRLIGLPTVLTTAEFEELARAMLDAVVERVRILAPEAQVVIEKTPSNSLMVPVIERLVPQASYVHIVRDPRDVAVSLLETRKTWGRKWAPRSSLGTALMWRSHVMGAMQAERCGDRCVVIRYEELKDEPERVLGRVLRVLHIEDSPSLCAEIVASVKPGTSGFEPGSASLSPDIVGRLGSHGVREPEGFGDGTTRGKRLTPRAEWWVEAVGAGLMESFGYSKRHPSTAVVQPVVEAVMRTASSRLSPDAKRWWGLNIGRLL